MAKPILRQSERDAFFRQGWDLSPLLDPNQVDWPEIADFVRDEAVNWSQDANELRETGQHLKDRWTPVLHSKWDDFSHNDKDVPLEVSDSHDWLTNHPAPAHHEAAYVGYDEPDDEPVTKAKPVARSDAEEFSHPMRGMAPNQIGPGVIHYHRGGIQDNTYPQSWQDKAQELAQETGGFTIHDDPNLPHDAPETGYQVAVPGHEDTTKSTGPEFADYAREHRGPLTGPDKSLGTWRGDDGLFYTEPSQRIEDYDQAARATVDRDQWSMWGNDAFRTDPATGEKIWNMHTGPGGGMVPTADIPRSDIINQGLAGATGFTLAKRDDDGRQGQGQAGLAGRSSAVSAPHLRSGRRAQVVQDDGRGSSVAHRAPRKLVTAADLKTPDAVIQPPTAAPAFDPTGLVGTGGAGGTHGAQTFRNPTTGQEWVVKHPPPGQEFLANLDVAANHIAQLSGVDAPDTYLTDASKFPGLGTGPASAQVKFPNSTEAFPGKAFDPEKLSDDDLLTMQKHHALDWALSQHDSHPGGFVRLQDGRLAGIDKGQAFKMFGQDHLHWNFHPNQDYGETEPVYNTLYRNFAKGGRQILDPRQGELGKYIAGLQNIPDQEYSDTLRPYAEAAAKAGFLSHAWKHTGLTKPTLKPNDVEGFLAAANARRHALGHDMGDLYDRAMAHRMTGTKIASLVPRRVAAEESGYTIVPVPMKSYMRADYQPPPNELYGRLHAMNPNGEKIGELSWVPYRGKSTVHYVGVHPDYQRQGVATALLNYARENYSPNLVHEKSYLTPEGAAWAKHTGTKIAMSAPNPDTMHDLGQQLGTHGASLFSDPQGQWLIKAPNKGNEFLVPLDVATSHLQQMVGLNSAETHAIPVNGGMATAVKMYPGATQAWQKPPHLADVHPNDLLTLQKHHALDWLIANHDPHVGNFMRTPQGEVVGIDKGQAMKYMGQDRLGWDTHYNYYARPSIYNRLWKDFAKGRPGEMLDPREGELGDFVSTLQNIPDDKLRSMFTPYATAATHAGMLGTGAYGQAHADADPRRGLSPPRIPPNDPAAFLDALVARKNNLSNDLGEMYDKAATYRASADLGKPHAPEAAPGGGKHEMHGW